MVSVRQTLPQGDQPADLDLDAWLTAIAGDFTEQELDVIRQAGQLAARAHADQKRASGEPFLRHVLTVADILVGLHMDYETIAAALLHDVVEDTDVELDEVRSIFDDTIANLVDGVTKMGQIPGYAIAEEAHRAHHAESLRKMLMAMAEDVRVVLIKLADRLHNMRTLQWLPEEKRRRIANETQEIYAPLANRLGIWHIKWELEDLSFRYQEPETYKKIAFLLDERRVDREQFIEEVIGTLQLELRRLGIKADITGRPKHIYSIWRKMKRKHIDFHQVFDVRAVRILVNDIAACYAVLGIVHSLWKPVPGEFDDYIGTPKDNNYQSLHTAVIGPGARTVEIQIRTSDMHEHAELGVAAHWRYKEGGKQDSAFEEKIAWMRQLLEWRDEATDAGDFIDRFKSEVFQDRVYVLTPAGKVMDLPSGATPLDFAYYIHTDVGHRCRGAKVDGHIVPLTYTLQNGETVEIRTSRSGVPSRDWLSPHLGYLKTSRARAKARTWFRQQDFDENLLDGRSTLERELRRLGVGGIDEQRLLKRFHHEKFDDLLAAVGRGEINTAQIAGAVEDPARARQQPMARQAAQRSANAGAADEIQVEGVGNLLTQMAKCCKPVPYDPIIGYITRDRGVTIHRRDCPSLLRMQDKHRDRIIEADWGGASGGTYPVDIHVTAYDRRGLLRDISNLLAGDRVNVVSVNTQTTRNDNLAVMQLTLEIQDLGQLSRLLDRIGQLPNVIEVSRRH